MLTIRRFQCNMLQENCYVAHDETLEAIVIDCGAYYEEERQAIVRYIRSGHLKPRHLLCTHGHFDHCFGNDTIWRAFGLQPSVPAADAWLMDMDRQMQTMMGSSYTREVPPVGRWLQDGDTIDFGTHQLSVLSTPGHTPGGVVFYCAAEHVAFTGDTLFRMSIGRTDFERGSWPQMQHSLSEVIAKLPPETRVLSGHGPETSIADELAMNPYLRG